ncbi:MAG TPA: hypothetical protein VG621_00370 [Candidatus Paceibacterota bacterium]|nr:hypothetical protein [Candidatus Paceibacterota bacterium]
MRINFFEEYPTEENMNKLEMVDWPATVLVAAPSLSAFESIRSVYTSKYSHITFGWWPTIPDSYWVSGFATPLSLDRLFAEITSKKQEDELPILVDLELPRKKSLYFKNLFTITKNKKKIHNFFEEAPNHNVKVYTAEYPALNNLFLRCWRMLGISPPFTLPHTKLIMCYTSMGEKSLGKKVWSRAKQFEKQFASLHPHRVGFGLGTIATGVSGDEPILSPEALIADLHWAKQTSAKEVFIFRLGGLNEVYVSTIKRMCGCT